MAPAADVAPVVRVGVGVLLVDDMGRVLVGRRRGSHGAGTLQLPGGHLEVGESFEECASRELAEETGIVLAPGSFSHAHTTNDVMPDDEKHYVTIFMASHVPEGLQARTLEPHKCEGWAWQAWDDLADGESLFIPLANLIASGFSPCKDTRQIASLQARASRGLFLVAALVAALLAGATLALPAGKAARSPA